MRNSSCPAQTGIIRNRQLKTSVIWRESDIYMIDVVKKINHGFMMFIKGLLIVTGTTMTILVITNVILRYAFSSGLTWSEEAARFLFIWTTFLGALLVNDHGIHGDHMRMDFVIEKFHGKTRKVIEILTMAIILFLLVMLFLGSIHLVTSTWAFETSALKLPKGAVYLCAPICFGYMALQTIAKVIMIFRASEDELNGKGAA